MAERLSTVKRPSALEFNFETRYVVLNFLGQVPVTPSSSSRTSFATSLTNRSSLQSQASRTSSVGSSVEHTDSSSGSAGSSGSGSGIRFIQDQIPDALPQVELTQDVLRQYRMVHDAVQISTDGQNTDSDEGTPSAQTIDKHFLLPVEMRLKSGSFSSVSSDRTLTPARLISVENDKVFTQYGGGIDIDAIDKLYLDKCPTDFRDGSEIKPKDTLDPSSDENLQYNDKLESKATKQRLKDLTPFSSPARQPLKDLSSLPSESELNSTAAEADSSSSTRYSAASMSTVSIDDLLHKRPSTLSITDISNSDVQSLVRESSLPAVALPLKEELSREFMLLEKDYEKAIRSDSVRKESISPTSMLHSPESVIAQRLGTLGDRIQLQYGDQLSLAVNDVISTGRSNVSYAVLKKIAENDGIINNSLSGWRQVALLLTFSRNLALELLHRGERGIGQLTEYTVKLVEDQAAEFILEQGGWESITNLDLTPEYSPPASISDVNPMFLNTLSEDIVDIPPPDGASTSDITADHIELPSVNNNNYAAATPDVKSSTSSSDNPDGGSSKPYDPSNVRADIVFMRQFSDCNVGRSRSWTDHIPYVMPVMVVGAAVVFFTLKRFMQK